MKGLGWLRDHRTSLLLGLLLVIVAVIVLGTVLLPQIFYDQWIWKYYWGPVVADAQGRPAIWNGVTAYEGYTIVSELTYGVILIVSLLAIYKLLKRLNVTVDWWFCVALLPYILFGPVTRVLEDTEYFTEPAVYTFISPFIYLLITAFVLFFLFLGYLAERRLAGRLPARTVAVLLIGVFVVIDAVYALLVAAGISFGVRTVEPLAFVLLSLVALLPIAAQGIYRKIPSLNVVVFSGGLLLLLPCLLLLGTWIAGQPWSSSAGVSLDAFLVIVGIVAAVTAAVGLVGYVLRKRPGFAVYALPLNLAMLAGHLTDGVSSWVSIYDPFGLGLPSYVEKHPASNALLEVWPPLFPLVKGLLIIMVIYLFDIAYRQELQRYSRLVNLLKIGIFILGVSPGVRDLLRVTLGV